MTGPLHDVRILDLTRLLPGGYATLLMADLGADVVKVEEPGKGDYIRWTPPMVGANSASHVALNRNKRSVTLDLKKEEGKSLFLRLVRSFDVVIESFRPGVMDRLDLGWDRLRTEKPALIYCAITGFGQDGPRARVAGHDVNYMGYAGALSIMGEEDRRLVIPGLQIGDLAGGGMAAVISVLSALHRRAVTGQGALCDVSMTDGVFSWLSIHAAQFLATKQIPERELMPLSGAYPCYRVYPAADGWLSVGALEPQFWSALCEALGRPDLEGAAFAVGERRQEVIDELDALFATRTRAQWVESFAGRDVCVGPVNDFTEAFEDEQIKARGMIVEGELEGNGAWRFVGNPIKISDHEQPELVRRPPPGLGEHTDELLAEIGLADSEIRQLRQNGIL